MKKSLPPLLFPLDLLRLLAFPLLASAAHGQIQQAWVARYNNGLTNGQHQALKMALASDGGIYVCGFSQNANSNLDYAVLKYASNGNLLWVSRYNTTNMPQAMPSGFALGIGNNTFVTGNAGTISYDASGTQRWTAPYAGLAVAADTSSNSFVTGFGTNFNTVKLNPGGTNLWMATSKDVGPTVGQTVVTDDTGAAYVCGSDVYYYFFDNFVWRHYSRLLTAKFSSSGDSVWTATAPAMGAPDPTPVQAEAEVFSGSNLYIAVCLSLSGGFNFATLCYSDTGTSLWTALDPTQDLGSIPYSLAIDSQANVYITGQNDYYGYPNSVYATYKISPAGSYVWTNAYPFTPSSSHIVSTLNVARGIVVDSVGNCYVTGFSPASASSNDIVTIAYDTNGKQLWLQRYDGPAHGDDEGNAIAVDTNGNVYVAGYDTPIGGGTEMVLIKYSPVTAKHEANGNFQLQAQGSANEPFDIRASTNLESWLDLGDFDADTNGLLQFTDTNAGQFPSRFYLAIPH